MCVIAMKPEGSTLTKEVLKKMWERNSDGAGFVGRINKDSEWVFKKGIMTYDEAERELEPYLNSDAKLVVHFRIKSKGDISPEMTHPFNFAKNDSEKRFLFHNGTVRLFTGVNGCSDSSGLADMIKPVNSKSVSRILEHLVKEKFGRFVTFVQKDGKDAQINIYEDEESKWQDGIWFSNLKHEEETKVVVYNYNNSTNNHRHSSPANGVIVSAQFDAKRIPYVDKIVAFYLKKDNLVDNPKNRASIIEHYSISIMCEDFLRSIVEQIESPDLKVGDPILNFFEI